MKLSWNVKLLCFSITSSFIRQIIGSSHFHCLPHLHIFWGMHESLQFAIILFLKELGNLIRKKEISSLWNRAQYSLRLQRELLVPKWFGRRRWEVSMGSLGTSGPAFYIFFEWRKPREPIYRRTDGNGEQGPWNRIQSYQYQKHTCYNNKDLVDPFFTSCLEFISFSFDNSLVPISLSSCEI